MAGRRYRANGRRRAVFVLTLLSAVYCLLSAAAAEEPAAPLEITADNSLEWHRNEKQYVANGNAVAKQGDVSVAAQVLTALYNETQSSAFDIYRLTATGGIVIAAQGSTATGDDAVYDVPTGLATITGKNLKMTSPDQTVTAHDKLEYQAKEGRLSAIGNALVVRGTNSLNADKISAWFAPDKKDGGRRLSRLVAEGHVIIKTPDEILTGAHAQYEAATDRAELTGGVRITRGLNVLEGEKAEVNLATNVSRMIGGAENRAVCVAFFIQAETKEKLRRT